MINFLSRTGNTAVEFLVSPPIRKFRWVNLVCLSLLFGGGLYQWCKFLNWGRGPLNFHDWAEITAPRLTFLQDAMIRGLLPLHTAYTEALGGITTRFMAIPDVILSPQIILLRYLDLSAFIIFQLSLMYTLGFWGLLLLRKKFELSILAFTYIFLLYNFNGHILAHFSVGHFTWGGNFLFIWFTLFVFELIEGKTSWRWVTKFAILLFAILLQGSYHQFVWCILFMLSLAIFSIKNIVTIIKGVAFSILISMVRLLPPFILLGKFNNQFIEGYRDTLSILNCLTHLQIPRSQTAFEDVSAGMSTWESTIFVGVIGAAFLIYFGFRRTTTNANSNHSYKLLLLPALCLTFLSLERVFETFRKLLPLPLLTGERVSSRIFSLAFIVILVLATIEFQSWLNQSKASKITILIPVLSLLLEVNDLWQNYVLWSVGRVSGEFPVKGYSASQWYVANNWGDTQYLSLIVLGFIISMVSLVFLICKLWTDNINQSEKRRIKT
jgi:hypothetical protein